jgi:hypothetical protein
MFPPLFARAAASGAVTSLLGTNPTRLYLFGEAPQNVVKPYAVWQIVGGYPYNYLNGVPTMDFFRTQVDVYGATASSALAAAQALRDAFEPVAHVVSWRGELRDATTQNYRYSFDVEWHVAR